MLDGNSDRHHHRYDACHHNLLDGHVDAGRDQLHRALVHASTVCLRWSGGTRNYNSCANSAQIIAIGLRTVPGKHTYDKDGSNSGDGSKRLTDIYLAA